MVKAPRPRICGEPRITRAAKSSMLPSPTSAHPSVVIGRGAHTRRRWSSVEACQVRLQRHGRWRVTDDRAPHRSTECQHRISGQRRRERAHIGITVAVGQYVSRGILPHVRWHGVPAGANARLATSALEHPPDDAPSPFGAGAPDGPADRVLAIASGTNAAGGRLANRAVHVRGL
jgi:hypothetical protein